MKAIHKLLKRLGYGIFRIPRSESTVEVSKQELREVERLLRQFAQENKKDAKAWSQYLSKERIRFFHELVRKCQGLGFDLNGLKIADVGSGTGYLFRALQQNGVNASLRGYDTYPESFPLAKLLCPEASYVEASLFDIDEGFEVVFCTEVLEHMVSPGEAIRHMSECLAPKGKLIFTVPNGRIDHLPAGDLRADGTAYWGHVHFWSPESWDLFLADILLEAYQIQTGLIGSDKLYGIATKI